MGRVLLVDGNELARAGAREVLAGSGLQVVGEAGDTVLALRLCERLEPDVLVVAARITPFHATQFLCLLPEERRAAVVVLLEPGELCAPGLYAVGVRGYVVTDSALRTLPEAVRTVLAGGTWASPGICAEVERCALDPSVPNACPRFEGLSAREREVFALAAHGFSNAEIGGKLFISPRTVEVHRTRSFRKLGIESLSGAIAFARRIGLFAGNDGVK